MLSGAVLGEVMDGGELHDGGEDEEEAHEDVDVQGRGVGDAGQVVAAVQRQVRHGQHGGGPCKR